MPPKSASALADVHPQRLENVRPVMAKADLKKVEEAKQAHGRVLARAIQLAGLTRKEAAALIDLDEQSLSRQIAAKEAQQTWRFQQHPKIGPALLLAQAEDETGVVVRHVIEMKVGA